MWPRVARVAGSLALMLVGACTQPNPTYQPGDVLGDAGIDPGPDAPDAPPSPADGGVAPADGPTPGDDAVAPPPDTAGPADEVGAASDDGPLASDQAGTTPDDGPAASDQAGTTAAGPRQLLVASSGSTTASHGSTGGDRHNDSCPGGQVLIGFVGTVDVLDVTSTPIVFSLQGQCGQPAVTGSGPYQIAIAAADPLPGHGVPGATSFTARCPTDQVVVGFFGRAGRYLDKLGLRCAPLTGSADATLSLGTSTEGTLHGGSGGTAFDDACPPGQLARGQQIDDGNYIDALALPCAPATLQP